MLNLYVMKNYYVVDILHTFTEQGHCFRWSIDTAVLLTISIIIILNAIIIEYPNIQRKNHGSHSAMSLLFRVYLIIEVTDQCLIFEFNHKIVNWRWFDSLYF
jgi:hypothetical protein